MSKNVGFSHVPSIIGTTVPKAQALFQHSCADRVIHNVRVTQHVSFQDRLNRLWREREVALGLAKLSNKEVAKACKAAGHSKISERAISALRTTEGRLPSAGNLKALADYFGVDQDWLLTGKGEPNPVTSLTEGESELLLLFRSLSDPGKGYILGRAQAIYQDEYRHNHPKPPSDPDDDQPPKLFQ